MYRVICSLLLILIIITSNVTSAGSAKGSGRKAKQWNELMEKMDNISTQMINAMKRTGNTETVELEMKLQTTRDELNKTKADLRVIKNEMLTLQANQEKAESDQLATQSEVGLLTSRESNPGSSTFVRWGRKSCPGNTTLVYTGVAGGKHFSGKGSGTNRLCLSRQPEFDDNIDPAQSGNVFGAVYQHFDGHHDHDVPCSVCRAPLSSTIMVPGTRTCPPAWTTQYHGHLASQYHLHYASEYVCVDQDPENGSQYEDDNPNGNLFYYTKASCGSLPCPPYVNDKIVTCVVCSK